jgi:hypothetical protein
MMTFWTTRSTCLPTLSDLPIDCLRQVYDHLDLCDRTNVRRVSSQMRAFDKENGLERLFKFQGPLKEIADNPKTPFEVAVAAQTMSDVPQLFGHWPSVDTDQEIGYFSLTPGEALQALQSFRQTVMTHSDTGSAMLVRIFVLLRHLRLVQECKVFASRLPTSLNAESVNYLKRNPFFRGTYQTKLSDLCSDY